MFQGYYNLASNLIVQNRNMNVISNNMTNISTPGFKSDQLVQGTFRDEILYRFERDGRTPIGTTSRINTAEGVATDQTQGTLRATERALDLALSGKGFFAVQSGQETVYTRNGSFNVDNEGYLVLQGLGRVQGQNGPIRVNTDDIRVTEQGYVLSADGRENYGRLQVVDFADVVFLAVKPQFQCAAAGRKWYGDQAGISGRFECVDGAGDDEHDERSAVASEFGAAFENV